MRDVVLFIQIVWWKNNNIKNQILNEPQVKNKSPKKTSCIPSLEVCPLCVFHY